MDGSFPEYAIAKEKDMHNALDCLDKYQALAKGFMIRKLEAARRWVKEGSNPDIRRRAEARSMVWESTVPLTDRVMPPAEIVQQLHLGTRWTPVGTG